MVFKLKKIILTFLVVIMCLLNVQAMEHLRFNGFIADNANILSEHAETELNQVLSELKKKTKTEIAIVTINSLKGDAIENVSLKIGRDYKLGDKKLNNGAVMLVALNDRKVRIEIGYGLEGAITDAHSGRILDDYVIPEFKEGNYENGIVKGTLVLANDIATSYGQKLSTISALPESPTTLYTTYETATLAELYQTIRDLFAEEDDGTGTVNLMKIMLGIILIVIAYAFFLVFAPLILSLLCLLLYIIIPVINIFIVRFNGNPLNAKKIIKKIDAFSERHFGGDSYSGSTRGSYSSSGSHSSSSSRSFGDGGDFGGGGSTRGW